MPSWSLISNLNKLVYPHQSWESKVKVPEPDKLRIMRHHRLQTDGPSSQIIDHHMRLRPFSIFGPEEGVEAREEELECSLELRREEEGSNVEVYDV